MDGGQGNIDIYPNTVQHMSYPIFARHFLSKADNAYFRFNFNQFSDVGVPNFVEEVTTASYEQFLTSPFNFFSDTARRY